MPTVTRSELEERFLALVRRGGLPDPEVNARLARLRGRLPLAQQSDA